MKLVLGEVGVAAAAAAAAAAELSKCGLPKHSKALIQFI